MKTALEAMNCWSKYKSYTATNNIPKVLRETDAVISSETVEVEAETTENVDITSEENAEVAF